ncbi:MAG: hypothetical protein J0L56_14400 [Chitinophagales bacterium]|nr:hypothetical protein [Chitinophagales bacterium]
MRVFSLRAFYLAITLNLYFAGQCQCYEQLRGQGLYLYSPVKTKLTKYKPLIGKEWGDSVLSKCAGVGTIFWKRVAPGYVLEPGTPIYAAHSGILRVHTTGGNPEPYDACWIDGENISTAYFHIYPSAYSTQYVYAGQRIGTVIPRKDTTYMYFSIRMAKPIHPTMKRGSLPLTGDKDCLCYIDPVWPEYFVNPTEWAINWDYNDSEPKTTLSVNITPSWLGKWSFDNGKTWLKSGESVNGLPQKYYKIIFKDIPEWDTPVPLEISSTDAKSNYSFTVTYQLQIKEKTFPIQQAQSSIIDSNQLFNLLDSTKEAAYDSSYQALRNVIYNTFNDSPKSKISKIEDDQKRSAYKDRILFTVLPISLLLGIGLILGYFQYVKIKKQKKYVENLQKELHHRVRNNLGIITALIDEANKNPGSAIQTKDLEARINSISFVHELLYQQDDTTVLNLQSFLEKLCDHLISSYSSHKKTLCEINAHISIPAEQSTQLALIIAELITNSLKHGKKGNGILKIKINSEIINNKIKIIVADNGVGFIDFFKSSKSGNYGILMVKGLVKQINGNVRFYNNEGAIAEFTF